MTEHTPSLYQFHVLVIEERKRQIAKGYDAAHDDEHGVDHLLTWAQDYARRGSRRRCPETPEVNDA